MLILTGYFRRGSLGLELAARKLCAEICVPGWYSSCLDIWQAGRGCALGDRWGRLVNWVGSRAASGAAKTVEEYWDFTDDEWEFEEQSWRKNRENPKRTPLVASKNWKLQGNLEQLEELGMNESELRRMVAGAKAMANSRPTAIYNKIEWCKDTLSMTTEDIKRFLLKNPWVLNYSSQVQLRPFTSVLFSKGLDPEVYKQMVIKHPDVLRQARLGDISRILNGFMECGFTAHQFLCMVAVDSTISKRSWKKEIKLVVDHFLDLGLNRDDFVSIVPRDMQILDLHSTRDYGVVLDRLLDFGLSEDQTKRIQKKNPNLIGSDLERRLNWWS